MHGFNVITAKRGETWVVNAISIHMQNFIALMSRITPAIRRSKPAETV